MHMMMLLFIRHKIIIITKCSTISYYFFFTSYILWQHCLSLHAQIAIHTTTKANKDAIIHDINTIPTISKVDRH